MTTEQAVAEAWQLIESCQLAQQQNDALETLITLAQQFEELDGNPCVVCGGETEVNGG